jgi:hypothetical protein
MPIIGSISLKTAENDAASDLAVVDRQVGKHKKGARGAAQFMTSNQLAHVYWYIIVHRRMLAFSGTIMSEVYIRRIVFSWDVALFTPTDTHGKSTLDEHIAHGHYDARKACSDKPCVISTSVGDRSRNACAPRKVNYYCNAVLQCSGPQLPSSWRLSLALGKTQHAAGVESGRDKTIGRTHDTIKNAKSLPIVNGRTAYNLRQGGKKMPTLKTCFTLAI